MFDAVEFGPAALPHKGAVSSLCKRQLVLSDITSSRALCSADARHFLLPHVECEAAKRVKQFCPLGPYKAG